MACNHSCNEGRSCQCGNRTDKHGLIWFAIAAFAASVLAVLCGMNAPFA